MLDAVVSAHCVVLTRHARLVPTRTHPLRSDFWKLHVLCDARPVVVMQNDEPASMRQASAHMLSGQKGGQKSFRLLLFWRICSPRRASHPRRRSSSAAVNVPRARLTRVLPRAPASRPRLAPPPESESESDGS